MHPSVNLLIEVLQAHNVSVTKARKHVFSALYHQQPQKVDEIIARLDGVVDRASIYRTITLFEKLDIVQRIYKGWKYKIELTDRFHKHHHHLICVSCDRIISFDEPNGLLDVVEQIASSRDFSHMSHQFEIYGQCKTCLKNAVKTES